MGAAVHAALPRGAAQGGTSVVLAMTSMGIVAFMLLTRWRQCTLCYSGQPAKTNTFLPMLVHFNEGT